MKKILFSLQIVIIVAAFPLYFFAEVNHREGKAIEKNENKLANKQIINNGNTKLFVILKMPAAPEYQVQCISN